MRLRLARICRTGDVLAEHAAFRRQRPEFFDVVNRCTAVSFALFDDPQLRHLVICLISRQADTYCFSSALSDSVGRLEPSGASAGASMA